LTTHIVLLGLLLGAWTFAQAPASRTAEFEKRSRDVEAKELAVPFKGITVNGAIEPGLWSTSPRPATTTTPKPGRTTSSWTTPAYAAPI
jgi:hypothetical protein